MTRPLVIYHGPGCADGFGAAFAAHTAFGDGADYLAVDAGGQPPAVDGRHVFVFDLSFPADAMIAMAAAATRLEVYDHHATGEARIAALRAAGLPNVVAVFDNAKSGAVMACERLLTDPVPAWAKYVQDSDLWRFALPDSREVRAYVSSLPHDFDVWANETPKIPSPAVVAAGRAVIAYQQTVIDDHVRQAAPVNVVGCVVPCVNATVLRSEIGERLAVGHPFSVTYRRRTDGRYVWSLRSAPGGLNVAAVAQALGGGGHVRAAGCTRDDPPDEYHDKVWAPRVAAHAAQREWSLTVGKAVDCASVYVGFETPWGAAVVEMARADNPVLPPGIPPDARPVYHVRASSWEEARRMWNARNNWPGA